MLALLTLAGCVHHIHVAPEPDQIATEPFPLTLQVVIPYFILEGADHMPGIALLDWRWQDFRQGVVDYIDRRRSFVSVGTVLGEATLAITAKLTLRSRDRYIYRLRLDADLSVGKTPVMKTYVVESEVPGSSVRWVTASDQEPIAEAVRQSLNQLLTAIEADRTAILTAKRS